MTEDSVEKLDQEGPAKPTACAYTEYREGTVPGDVPATGEDATGFERAVWDRLYAVEDPEMPVSIVDLGLIYGVAVDESDGSAIVEMTLTYSGCPAREMLLDEIEASVSAVEGIEAVELRLVWSPPWTVDMVTDTGRDCLREFGVSV